MCYVHISTANRSVKQSKNNHCSDENCSNDRLQRDATLAIIDYDNQRVVCDVNHPHVCDTVDPLDDIKAKLKKNLEFDELVHNKVWPFEAYQPNKRNYQSSLAGNNKNVGALAKSNLPNPNGFVCAEYGFFPGMTFKRIP